MAKGKGGGWNWATNGFNGVDSAKLKNVKLPDKLKCDRCKIFKKIEGNYSNKQLADLRFKVLKHGQSVAHQVRCRQCTGQQVMELHCHMCDKTKGLEDFAKTHRRNPDKAKCKNCINEQLAADPDYDVNAHDSDDDSNATLSDGQYSDEGDDYSTSGVPLESLSLDDNASTTDTSYTTTTDENSNPSGISRPSTSMNSSGTPGGVKIGLWSGRNTNELIDDGWTTPKGKSKSRTGVVGSSQASASMSPAWNPHKYGHPGRSYASSVAGSSASYGTAAANSSSTRKDSKWMKIPAVKKKPEPSIRDEEEEEVVNDPDWTTQAGDSDKSDGDSDSDSDDDYEP